MEEIWNSIKDKAGNLFGGKDGGGPQWGNVMMAAATAAIGGIIAAIFAPASALITVLGLVVGGIVGGLLSGNSTVQKWMSSLTGGALSTSSSADSNAYDPGRSKAAGLGIGGLGGGAYTSTKLAVPAVKFTAQTIGRSVNKLVPDSAKGFFGKWWNEAAGNARSVLPGAKSATAAAETVETGAPVIKGFGEIAATAAKEGGLLAKAAPALKGGGKFVAGVGTAVTFVVDGGQAVKLLKDGEIQSGLLQGAATLVESGSMAAGETIGLALGAPGAQAGHVVGALVGGGVHDGLYIVDSTLDTIRGKNSYEGIRFFGSDKMTTGALSTLLREYTGYDPVKSMPLTNKVVGAYYDWRIEGVKDRWAAEAEEKAKTLIDKFNDKDKATLNQMVAEAHEKGDSHYTTLRAIFDLTDKKMAQLPPEAQAKVHEVMKKNDSYNMIMAINEVETGHQPSGGTSYASGSTDGGDKNKTRS